MNKSIRCVTVLGVLGAFFFGCAPVDDEEVVVSNDSAIGARALAITGDWALVSWKGHVTTRQGSIVEDHPVERSFDAQTRNGLATFALDSDGNGTIAGKATCAPTIPDRGGIPSGTRASQTVTGLFALVSAVWNIVELFTCTSTQVSRSMPVFQRRGFFGGPDPHLNANLGVYGEAREPRAAEEECRTMWGVRWLAFGSGGAACAGFADAEARTLKLLVQRPGEIYVQRLVLRRPADP